MTNPTCSGPLTRIAAPCQDCGECSTPRHVNRTSTLDERYNVLVETARIVCGKCCKVCAKEGE